MKKQKVIYDMCIVMIALSQDGAAFDAVAFKSVGPERLAKLCKKAKLHVAKIPPPK
jgi:hypothetical protein